MKEEIEGMGYKVYPIEMGRDINIKQDIASFFELKDAIGKIKPDLVHLHSSKAGVLGKMASYLNKVPCIYNAHGWSFSMNVSKKKKKLYALIERYTSVFCNYIVNISDSEYELAKEYKIANENKMGIIYNGINIQEYNDTKYDIKLKEALGIPEESFVIGTVARITEQKDPIKFVEIANKICKMHDDIYFVWVGDGELRNSVEELIYKYDLSSKVKLVGWMSDVEKYISIFDIGLLTSKWEGFGLSILEYMASNKPVIASNVGGIKSIIKDGYNGKLIEADNVNEFINAIIGLKENKEVANIYAINGLNTVKEKFDIKNLINQHKNLYARVYSENRLSDKLYKRGL